MLYNIEKYMKRPPLYAPSTSKFWDDEHIPKGMLEAHLNPEFESATSTLDFVQNSVEWISETVPAREYSRLIDLGCGPGIYAELFDDAGYQVTGIDLSKRSIDYARRSAKEKNKDITYECGSYLTMNYQGQFNLATLIYCDFGVLSTQERAELLGKIYSALYPGGRLILDVFTPQQYADQEEYRDWVYEESGFWSPKPYLCLNSLYHYEEESTFLRQHIVVTEDTSNCYNVWEHTFTKDELTHELCMAGFEIAGFYSDVTGTVESNNGKQLCVIAYRS